jgi:hypothetical protein
MQLGSHLKNPAGAVFQWPANPVTEVLAWIEKMVIPAN